MPPSIAAFLYSDGVRQEIQNQQPSMSIINPRIVLTPMFIPGQHSFAATFGVIEIETGHTIQYTFKNQIGEEQLLDSGKITLPDLPEDQLKLPPEMRNAVLCLDFKNVVFKENGTYISEIFYDGASIGIFPIQVRGVNTSE
jgi:hypothetical protein